MVGQGLSPLGTWGSLCDCRANGSTAHFKEKWGRLVKAVRERGAGSTSGFPCGHTLGWRVGNLGVVEEDDREEPNHEET